MTKEETVRSEVKKLQKFYLSLLNYAVVNGIFCLIWLVFDSHSSFWPKYVMFFWGAALAIKASRIGVGTLLYKHVPFLTSEWEQDKIREMMGSDKKTAQTKVPLKRDAKPKKAAARKTVAVKAASVKAAPKKAAPKKKSKARPKAGRK